MIKKILYVIAYVIAAAMIGIRAGEEVGAEATAERSLFTGGQIEIEGNAIRVDPRALRNLKAPIFYGKTI